MDYVALTHLIDVSVSKHIYTTLFCSLNEVHSFSILSPFFEFLVISITNVVPYDNKFVVFLTARIAVLKRPLSRELFEIF